MNECGKCQGYQRAISSARGPLLSMLKRIYADHQNEPHTPENLATWKDA